ncbi:hypothetical protein J2Z47_006102, partial [Cohnella thailandensis]|nr:hypothetical protein [Cohnella thailandensis]
MKEKSRTPKPMQTQEKTQTPLQTQEQQPSQERDVSLKLFVVLSKAYKSIMDSAVKDMKKHGLSAT